MADYNPSTSSGPIAVSTTSVVTRASLLCNAVLVASTAACTMTVYDNASAASGTVLWKATSPASGASVPANFSIPVVANSGLTVVVTGTGAQGFITYTLE